MITGNKVIISEKPFCKVIPCVTVQCPFDSSVKGLLLEILRKVDESIGTRYYESALRARSTTDMLIGSVSQVCLNHVGMLIVDEIQNVVNSRNGRSLVGMLTQILNPVTGLYGNLYRKQGTTFPIVLILIDGRTAWNGDLDHVWHRYDPHTDSQISTFDGLFARISKHFSPSISPLFDNEIALAKLNSDTSLQLTETDKASLRNAGAYVSDDDFDYLEKVVKEMKYYEQRFVDFKISAQKAISILGRKEFWSGVYRAAYHGTAMRGTKEPYVIFIMPGHSFYGINDDNTTDIIITFKKKKDVRRSLNSCQNEHGQILCAFDRYCLTAIQI